MESFLYVDPSFSQLRLQIAFKVVRDKNECFSAPINMGQRFTLHTALVIETGPALDSSVRHVFLLLTLNIKTISTTFNIHGNYTTQGRETHPLARYNVIMATCSGASAPVPAYSSRKCAGSCPIRPGSPDSRSR